MKITSIVGARPQFVKLAPLSRRLQESHDEIIVHTGQHYADEMSAAFFRDLSISPPDYNLGIGSGSHGVQTGKMLIELEAVLNTEKPELVIVFGDTNSTFAGALVSAKLHIPVVHIEAGLRSYNRMMPEEINRVGTDHIADYLFAPTQTAMDNLNSEGLGEISRLTGDIMVDTLKDNLKNALGKSEILNKLELEGGSYYLLTLHRPYNVDDPAMLNRILSALEETNIPVVFPVHPRTKKVIEEHGISQGESIVAIEPQGYLDFIVLESNANKIITDSGGIQKEAYILKKPCITLRPETEWVETVQDGWNVLVNPVEDDIAGNVLNFNPSGKQSDVFGRDVADTMVANIEDIFHNE